MFKSQYLFARIACRVLFLDNFHNLKILKISSTSCIMFAENIVTGRQIMAEIHPEKNVLLLREQIYCELRNLAVNSLPGTRLPSENAIAAKFKAARMTVSWAFRKLEEEHLIERRKGCGSFVRGIRTVTYLLPDIAILTSIGANAAVHRECMQGIMHAAKELQLRLETAVINIDNDPQKIDVQQLSTFHSGSMLITMPWFQECFQYLAEHRIRTALISNQNPYYGYKQYTYDWFRLEADRRVAVRKALEMLYGASCRKIAVTNLYLKETHHPVTDTYIEFIREKGLSSIFIELPRIGDCECSTCKQRNIVERNTYKYCNILREKLRAAYEKEHFDALVLNVPVMLFGKNINEYCDLPESVRIFGINIQPEQCELGEPFPCCRPPYGEMCGEAVRLLACSQRLGICRKYDYIFENTDQLKY